MARKLKVTFTDDRPDEEVLVGPKVYVAFERQYDTSLDELDRIEHMYYMGWAALHFAGREPRKFDEFLDTLEDVEDVTPEEDDGNSSDPTEPGQNTGDSSA